MLHDPSQDVVITAARALGLMGDPTAAGPILEAVAPSDARAGLPPWIGVESVASLGTDTTADVCAALDHECVDVRMVAALVISQVPLLGAAGMLRRAIAVGDRATTARDADGRPGRRREPTGHRAAGGSAVDEAPSGDPPGCGRRDRRPGACPSSPMVDAVAAQPRSPSRRARRPHAGVGGAGRSGGGVCRRGVGRAQHQQSALPVCRRPGLAVSLPDPAGGLMGDVDRVLEPARSGVEGVFEVLSLPILVYFLLINSATCSSWCPRSWSSGTTCDACLLRGECSSWAPRCRPG